MNFVAVFMSLFSLLGALDWIFGNRFGLGQRFQKGFHFFGNVALSMAGMIVLAPAIGRLLQPLCSGVYRLFSIDPSVIPAMLFANDMGGASLAAAVAVDREMGMFNALVVSSMMGCTISFTIPCALNIVQPSDRKNTLMGFLCGMITIPVGCFAAGCILGLPLGALLWNLLPMLLFSAVIGLCLVLIPEVCVKAFGILGRGIQLLIVVGLALGILKSLTGLELVSGLTPLEDAGLICFQACVVLSGAFPFLYLLEKGLRAPIRSLSRKTGIGEASVLGLISSLASSLPTFEKMKEMDGQGVMLNAAFSISGAFLFASHLAFTLAMDSGYVFPVMAGKLISGLTAVALAGAVYSRTAKKADGTEEENHEAIR